MSAPDQDRGNLDAILATAEHDRTRLNSSALGAFSLTLLGVASVVGAGIFVVTGDAAAHYAGPAVLISFILAGIVAGLTALCYAELASMIPAAGSTYSYAFAAFGSFVGWFIGWDLLLEYLFAASTVAVGWSGYFDSLFASFGVHLPHALVTAPFGDDPGIINLPAMAIMFLTSGALWLGTRESAIANNSMVLLKLSILTLVVGVGVFYVSSSNFEPFLPTSEGGFGDFGWSGVFRGAGIVFFAYIGFDAVSTAAAEARNPRRTVPIGLLGTVIIATVIYIAVGFVLTGMVNYRELGVADPIAVALQAGGRDLDWLLKLTDVAAVVGLASTVLVTLYGQTRIFMRMSEDGMLPPAFGKVSGRTKTPQFSIVLCGIVGGIVAGLVPLSVLGELISIGTLLAFIIVSAGVLTLRRRYPDLPRPFRVPVLPLVAGTAIVSSLALMATLPGDTWIRLGVWAALGLCVYFLYARAHSRETMGAISAGITSRPEPAPEDAWMSVHLLQRAPRNYNLAALHLTFFVAAIATELCIRTQLYLTHYPQLGGHGLHIAHLLWGGLFMVVALAILLTLLGRRPRQAAALVGGIGFGFFIDELGKFITADNNYFYRPAAGIIYLIFIGLYLGSRAYQRHRGLTEDERVRNAIELIGEANHGPFKAEYRDQALALLAEVPATHPLRDPLVALAEDIDTTPNPDPPWYRRFANAVAARYELWSERRWFHRAVIAVFAFWALASIATILGLVLSFGFADDAARAGFQEDSFSHLNFLNWATLVSTAISTAFVVLGLGRLLRGERLDAYLWLTRALLVSIFVTRVFTFVESQFGAVFGVAVDILLLVSVQLMARQERRRSEPAPAN